MQTLRARIAALLAVVLVALPAFAFAQNRYFCAAMGLVMESCCCKSASESPGAKCPVQVQAADCCELLESAEREATPAVRDGAATRVPAPALVATLSPWAVALGVDARELGGAVRQARAPPSHGPPLYLKHCVLLS